MLWRGVLLADPLLRALLAAIPANAAKLDPEVRHFEAERRGVGNRERAEILVIDVDDAVAAQTDQMVVDVDARVVTGHPTRVAGLRDHAHLAQGFQVSVHGGPGDTRVSDTHRLEHLVGGGVVLAVQDGLEEGASLDRARDARLPTQLLELLEAIPPVSHADRHGHTWIMMR